MGANPFIGGNYKQRKGMQTPPDRPDRVEPVPEHYEGENYPYRGTQTHGVNPTPGVDADAYYGIGMWDDGEHETIKTLPEEKVVEPVPVMVVQREGRERLDWRAGRFLVQSIPQEVAGRLETRRSLRLKNASEDKIIYIGPDSGLKPMTGYPLGPGEDVHIFSTENVFAVTDGTDIAELGILTEYAIQI